MELVEGKQVRLLVALEGYQVGDVGVLTRVSTGSWGVNFEDGAGVAIRLEDMHGVRHQLVDVIEPIDAAPIALEDGRLVRLRVPLDDGRYLPGMTARLHRWFVEADRANDDRDCWGVVFTHEAPYLNPLYFQTRVLGRTAEGRMVRIVDVVDYVEAVA